MPNFTHTELFLIKEAINWSQKYNYKLDEEEEEALLRIEAKLEVYFIDIRSQSAKSIIG